MKREDFADSPSGRLVSTIDDAWAFVPKPLPPAIDISPLSGLLTDAIMLIGELRGIGSLLPNPYLLIGPLQKREAVASSNIEGTVTSLSDLFKLEAGANEARRPPDTREVANYERALKYGIERLKEFSLSSRLLRELHAELLTGVLDYRGGNKQPGEFRRSQNWIGGIAGNIASAHFVPPPPNELEQTLSHLEKFIDEPGENAGDILVKVALTHYQFETIHPFLDGNGRVGRILLPLILCEKDLLPVPLLYLSPYFERYRDEYMGRLLEVSRTGDWVGWIEFFLKGIVEQCRDTIERINDLNKLREEYREHMSQSYSSAKITGLVDRLFESPILTIPMVRDGLEVSYPTAKTYVEQLTVDGVLVEPTANERPRLFIASKIFAIVNR